MDTTADAPVFDIHTHVLPPDLVAAMVEEPTHFQPARLDNGVQMVERDGVPCWLTNGRLKEIEPQLYDTTAKLAEMDRMGVGVSVLSITPPTYFYDLDADHGTAAARITNDGIAAMVAQDPARLRGMATLPMQDPEAAVKELWRVVDTHDFRAVELSTSIEGCTLDDPRFRPVLRAIAESGCFIFAHPNKCVPIEALEGYDLFNAVGFPLDEVIMAARLMFTGVLEQIPELRFVIAHGGGYLPYQIGRLQRVYEAREAARADSSASPRELMDRFYFDSITHDVAALRMLIDTVGADHVLVGSDNPFDMGYEDPVGELERVRGLGESDVARIRSLNAQALLMELP